MLAPSLPPVAQAQGGQQGPDLARYQVGPLPPEFVTDRTGQGQPGDWRVVDDASANGGKAIAQLSADPTDDRFPLAIFQPLSAQDMEATMRLKAISGRVDRAGGICVRLRKRGDYYLARANALEDNVNLYRVVRGNRQEIKGANAKVSSGQWHTVTLRAKGDRLTVLFNGQQVISATDRMFPEPGKVALWTKADSVSHFDRLEIRKSR
jgi:hypothetical protein